MSADAISVLHHLDAEFDVAVRQRRAIAEGTKNKSDRSSDKQAFNALVLAVQTILTRKLHEGSFATPKFRHSHGKGILSKDRSEQVTFYLHDGYLIVMANRVFVPPSIEIPVMITIPYARDVPGQVLSWYRFRSRKKT